MPPSPSPVSMEILLSFVSIISGLSIRMSPDAPAISELPDEEAKTSL
ncbi:MAG: hypothetical protein AB7S75_04225 [Desulfococcaceae bacterium]